MEEEQEKQQSQVEAEQKNELPEGARVDRIPVEEYQSENEQVHDKLEEFGESDLNQFLIRATSDSTYCRVVLRKLLGLDEGKKLNHQHVPSPQEQNLTGSLNHAVWPPKVHEFKDDK